MNETGEWPVWERTEKIPTPPKRIRNFKLVTSICIQREDCNFTLWLAFIHLSPIKELKRIKDVFCARWAVRYFLNEWIKHHYFVEKKTGKLLYVMWEGWALMCPPDEYVMKLLFKTGWLTDWHVRITFPKSLHSLPLVKEASKQANSWAFVLP